MIDIPQSPSYDSNVRNSRIDPCIVCGKDVRNKKHWLHMTVRGQAVNQAEAETLPEKDDQGAFPIGADCLRNNPELKPYLVK